MKVKAVMDQFKDGLAVGGVLCSCRITDLLRQLFVDEKPPLTVGIFWNLYKFIQSQFGHLQVY